MAAAVCSPLSSRLRAEHIEDTKRSGADPEPEDAKHKIFLQKLDSMRRLMARLSLLVNDRSDALPSQPALESLVINRVHWASMIVASSSPPVVPATPTIALSIKEVHRALFASKGNLADLSPAHIRAIKQLGEPIDHLNIGTGELTTGLVTLLEKAKVRQITCGAIAEDAYAQAGKVWRESLYFITLGRGTTHKPTDVVVEKICTRMPKLTHLIIANCSKMTTRALSYLQKHDYMRDALLESAIQITVQDCRKSLRKVLGKPEGSYYMRFVKDGSDVEGTPVDHKKSKDSDLD